MNAFDFSWERVSRLLGTRLSSKSLSDLFDRSDVNLESVLQPVPIRVSSLSTKAQTSVVVDTEEVDLRNEIGVKLRFKAAYLLVGLEALREALVFSGITYYAPGEDGAKQFPGGLPHGLSFSDNEQSVAQKLSQYAVQQKGANADGSYSYCRWDCSTYLLHAVFLSATSSLRRVNCYLHLK